MSMQKSRGGLFLASSLLDGLEDNDLRQVETLLSVKDANPNVLIPSHGVSPFHLVIGNECEEFAERVTKLFLRHGGDPNVKAVDGMTPVHVAAAWGRSSILELLLANGGDPLSLDDEKRSPFHYAFDGAFYDVVSVLAKYCGGQNEEEDESPKFKLTLDKILVNKGNVVAEYVNSNKLREISSKPDETTPENPKISNSIHKDKNLNCERLKTSNVTIRRNRKNEKETKTPELDIIRKTDKQEKYLVGKIIRRLSNSLSSDNTSEDILLNNLKNIKTAKENLKKEKNDFSRGKILAETSIISKSPNCRLKSIKDKTPKAFGSGYKKIDEQNQQYEYTPPSKNSKTPNGRIKSVNSTPKRKKCSRLNGMENYLESEKTSYQKNYDKNIVVRLDERLDNSSKMEKTIATDSKMLTPKKNEKKIEHHFESPGSSNPISLSYHQRTSNEYESEILDEIEEASKIRCESPPASISILEDSMLDNSTETVKNPSDESTMNCEFNETMPGSIFYWSPSESFVSVDEEYTYEDQEKGVAFLERHLRVISISNQQGDMDRAKEEASWINRFGELSIAPSEVSSRCSVTSSMIAKSGMHYDKHELQEKLRSLGEAPGPITKTTFNVYLKRLWRLEYREKRGNNRVEENVRDEISMRDEGNPVDKNLESKLPDLLLMTDFIERLEFYRDLEEKSFTEYSVANSTRKYRGGISKTSFCYLLLDPRITTDLPRCGVNLSLEEKWRKFLAAVFYVGKGKAARPVAHLYDAFNAWSNPRDEENLSRKIRRILDIWKNGLGVVCLHIFSHTMNEEACSREAAMIEALGTSHLTNCVQGTYYGYTSTMSTQEKQALGKFLLYKSMQIFMFEGERQLFPRNVIL